MSDQPSVPAEELRARWSAVLAASGRDGEHQSVTRSGHTVGVIAPADWYASAREAVPGPKPRVVASREARPMCSRLMTDVGEHGQHIVITVQGYETAVLLPVRWHAAAAAVLRPDPPEDPSVPPS